MGMVKMHEMTGVFRDIGAVFCGKVCSKPLTESTKSGTI